MSSSAKASQEAGLCVLTIQALLLCAEVAAFFCRFSSQSFGFSLGSSHVYAGQVLFMSLLSSILLGFHIFGESFRLQAEKLIF